MAKYWCYILRNTKDEYKNYTYCGFTTNPKRRLRQHNEEIKGGAKATKGKGQSWEFMMLMTGFKNNNNALSCEWRLKHPNGTRRKGKEYSKVLGRIKGINEVLKQDVWTQQCDIKNNECEYNVYILSEYYSLLDIENIPKNIKINSIECSLITQDIF